MQRQVKIWQFSALLLPGRQAALEQDLKSPFTNLSTWLRVLFFFLTQMAISAFTSMGFAFLNLLGIKFGTLMLFNSVFGICLIVAGDILIRSQHLYRKGVEEAFLLVGLSHLITGILFYDIYGIEKFSVQSLSFKTGLFLGSILFLLAFIRYGRSYFYVLASLFLTGFLIAALNSGKSLQTVTLIAIAVNQLVWLLIPALFSRKAGYQFRHARWSLIAFFQILLFYASTYGIGHWPELTSASPDQLMIQTIFFWMGWLIAIAALTEGLLKKQKWALDSGLIILLINLCTSKSYWALPSTAWNSLTLGLGLMASGGLLMAFFAKQKNWKGILGHDLFKSSNDALDVASLATAALAAPAMTSAQPMHGDGGRFGGGGASGEY